MSDASASPIPDAAARSNTPPSALQEVLASQPAKAIYPKASAASDALNCVVAPYCLAVSSSFCISSAVAPLSAPTFDILASNVVPISTILPAKSFKPLTIALIAVAARSDKIPLKTVNPSPALLAPSSTSSNFLPNPSNSFCVLFTAVCALFNSIRILDIDLAAASCSLVLFFSSCPKLSTTFFCSKYSEDVVPRVRPISASFAFSASYLELRSVSFLALLAY